MVSLRLNNNGNFPANFPVLDGKNYHRWVVQMKVIFRYQDVIDVVKDGVRVLDKDAT